MNLVVKIEQCLIFLKDSKRFDASPTRMRSLSKVLVSDQRLRCETKTVTVPLYRTKTVVPNCNGKIINESEGNR